MIKNKLVIKYNNLLFLVTLLTTFSTNISAGGIGAGVYAYPKAGQSQEQQANDKMFCHKWAVEEVGFDPSRNPSPQANYNSYSPSRSSSGGPLGFGSEEVGEGGVVYDGARGAATGALLGALAGDAGAGAAWGALGGALFGGIKRSNREAEERRWREQQEYQRQVQEEYINNQYNNKVEDYRLAYTVCITSKNYQVN
jgi:outer membrane protein with glycine zipper